MKTLKLIACITLISAGTVLAQNKAPLTPASTPTSAKTQPAQPLQTAPGAVQQTVVPGQPASGQAMPAAVRMNRYMVQLPHTKEQCETVKNQLKEKGMPIMMRFDWGCASGEHIGYALLGGQDEATVRKQLPDAVQKMIKVTKVDKANTAEMQQTQQMQQMQK